MPNVVNRERGGVVFEKAERGLPTITAATDDNDTSPTVYFVISARTHELGDTVGVASRRTSYQYYLTSTDLSLLTNTLVTVASSGATASAIVTTVAVIPDDTVTSFHHGMVITNSTGGAVVRFGVTAGTTCALVLITPDGLLAASTGVVATTT